MTSKGVSKTREMAITCRRNGQVPRGGPRDGAKTVMISVQRVFVRRSQ